MCTCRVGLKDVVQSIIQTQEQRAISTEQAVANFIPPAKTGGGSSSSDGGGKKLTIAIMLTTCDSSRLIYCSRNHALNALFYCTIVESTAASFSVAMKKVKVDSV